VEVERIAAKCLFCVECVADWLTKRIATLLQKLLTLRSKCCCGAANIDAAYLMSTVPALWREELTGDA
jgi:hypothetical protein